MHRRPRDRTRTGLGTPLRARARGLKAIAHAIALAIACGAGLSCSPKPEPPWHQEAGYRWRELNVPSGEAGFTRMTRTGVAFQNDVSDTALLGNRVLAQGAGVALGDVDG